MLALQSSYYKQLQSDVKSSSKAAESTIHQGHKHMGSLGAISFQ